MSQPAEPLVLLLLKTEMASEDLLMTDFVVLPDLIRTHATESPSHPVLIVGNEIGWVDLRCPKFGRVWRYLA
jgi:hypothetical protein